MNSLYVNNLIRKAEQQTETCFVAQRRKGEPAVLYIAISPRCWQYTDFYRVYWTKLNDAWVTPAEPTHWETDAGRWKRLPDDMPVAPAEPLSFDDGGVQPLNQVVDKQLKPTPNVEILYLLLGWLTERHPNVIEEMKNDKELFKFLKELRS